MKKGYFLSILVCLVLVFAVTKQSSANVEIKLDSASIPRGMAATGTLQIRPETNRPIVLTRGVAIMRGGVSWRIVKPDGSDFEISRNTSGVSISGVHHEVIIEPGASLNIPFCLLVWGRELIFDDIGNYHIFASVFLDDKQPPIVEEAQIFVSKGGAGFKEWREAFVPLGEVITPFYLGFFDELSKEGFAQTIVYGQCLEKLFVYNIGGANLYRFIVGDSFGHQENVKSEKLSNDIEQGRMLAQKTGYGLDFWDFIAARFKHHYPDKGNFTVEDKDFGNWRLR